MPNLKGLWVKWSGIKSLSALRSAPKLTAFHLGSSASLESIEPLAAMDQLEWLGLENMKRVSDFSPLSSLRSLRGLYLEGSMWSTQVLDTLDPIGKLQELRFLSLANLKARDQSLAPLFDLKHLETLRLASWWNPEEVSEIHRRNPMLVG